MKTIHLAYSALGVVIGIIGTYVFRGNAVFVVGVVCTLAFVLLAFMFRGYRREVFLGLILCGISVGVSSIRTSDMLHDRSEFYLDSFIGESVVISGTVVRYPDIREQGVDVVIRPETINDRVNSEHARVLIRLPHGDVKYGDAVTVSGVLRFPEPFETEEGRLFRYDHYLEKDRIYFTLRADEYTRVEGSDQRSLKSILFSIKENILSRIYHLLPEPSSSLLAGLLLGVRQALDPLFRQALIATGTIHIIALSGYNLSVIANAVMGLFRFFSRRVRFGSGIFFIILFAVMTGGSATVVRAAFMGSCALVARAFGRTAVAGRLILLSVIVLCLFDPLLLLYDVSFHLSILATLGVVYCTPITERWFRRLPARFAIRENASVTIGAMIPVLPYIVYTMGTISLVAPIANVLVLPLIPYAMALGFFAVIASLISFPLGLVVAFVSHVPLYLIEHIVRFFARIPFASFSVPEFSWVIIVILYVLIAVWVVLKFKAITSSMEIKIF